jgi:dTDP-glucose pyrophosphorylase
LRAIVLVGGEGTRLRPLTLTLPKQMLPVVEVPMLERVLAGLAALVALGALALWILRGPVQTHSVTIAPAAQGTGAPR